MSKTSVEIELRGREAELILNYGYPFPDQVPIFKAIVGKPGWHTAKIDSYWLELIIGDLSRSMRELKSISLVEELDEICTSLEMALERSSDRFSL